MALVNIGYSLAAAGKRVLLVDFDLEAPGLSSYEGFDAAQDRAGIVEYTRRYQREEAAPDASEYIVPCDVYGVPMWVMPAGRHRSPEYATDFNSINWRQLYRDQEGFLLFEDLKQQWADYEGRGFDYVLIDSRTGHTDIGGICTRQLPDAVVILFVPSKQNIDGLVPIVRTIRKEVAPVRERPVRLHFCPSNVPSAAEQEEILNRRLRIASEKLEYSRASAVIYHFDNMELLDQPIFTRTHPESRLTRQLTALKEAITKENVLDKPAALLALRDLPERFRRARADNDRSELEDISVTAASVRAEYPEDGEIAWCLAPLYNVMKRAEDELAVLDIAISTGTNVTPALLQRAFLKSSLDREGAIGDLVRLVGKERATIFEVIPALDFLRVLSPQQLPNVLRTGMLNAKIDAPAKSQILLRMLTPEGDLAAARDVAGKAYEMAKGIGRDALRASYVLTLIALGEFQSAASLITDDREKLLESGSPHDLFNYMIAEWGLTGECQSDLAKRVLVKTSAQQRSPDANGLQCYAVCRSVLGEHAAALEDLDAALARTAAEDMSFDCWRWRYVPRELMHSDLQEMVELARRESVLRPAFMANRAH